MSASAAVATELGRPQRDQPVGVRVAHGERLGRLAGREPGELGAPLARPRVRSTAFTKDPVRAAVSLAELDRLEHGGVSRHAVEVEELERRQTQGFAHLGRAPRSAAALEKAAITRSSELRRLIVPITSS